MNERSQPAAEQLRNRLRHDAPEGIVLTYAHWDHVSGIPDLPGFPVFVPAEERCFIDESGFLTVVAREIADASYEPTRSMMVPISASRRAMMSMNDGSMVIVPVLGTRRVPVTSSSLPLRAGGARSSATWSGARGILQREERPWLKRTRGDSDAEPFEDTSNEGCPRMRIHDPLSVPAHDARGLAAIPSL